MIQEAYCSYEVAKFLKEKGFNEPCLFYYFSDGKIEKAVGLKNKNTASVSTFSAPTHQMAMAWLREMYGTYIVFFHTNKSGWWYNITDMDTSYVLFSSEKMQCSYEDIVEAALKYSLENLI